MKRKTVFGSIAAIAAAGVIAGISVVWPGLDAQDAPPAETAVWALQTGDGHRYARVNTAVGELDTVRRVTNPSSIAQASGSAFVFADGKVARIDEAMPANLDEEALAQAGMMPPGTQDAFTSGPWVAYRTDAGEVLAGTLSTGIVEEVSPYVGQEETPSPTPSATAESATDEADAEADAEAEEDGPEYKADAIALNEEGLIFSYSRTDSAVLTFDADEREVVSIDPVEDAGETPLLTAVGSDWFLYNPETDEVFRSGGSTLTVETLGDAVLSRSMLTGTTAYIADQGGLISLPVEEGDAERVVGGADRDLGVPARPVERDGVVYAAWLGLDSGTLWQSGEGEITLDYNGATLDEQRRPTFLSSADAMILNETRKGWVWTVPDGALIESSQDWSLGADDAQNTVESDEQATVVVDPKPPVAVNDSFGVRAATLTALPIILNDHDPNEDVLSVDPSSIVQPDPSFGTVSLTDDGGRLVVKTTAEASGSATVSYRLTDGTAADGLYSNVATVTLNIVDDEANAAPEFCGVEECLATWAEPEVAPGGTVAVPVLNGWVDPEGDPLLVLAVNNPSGVGAAAITPAGEVVYQHHDSSSAETVDVDLEVIVSDTRGATSSKIMTVRVAPSPKLIAESFTTIDTFGYDISVDVARHVTGTVGKLALTDVRVMDSDTATVSTSTSGTGFDFTAPEPGTYRVSYTVTDGQTTASATARITMLPPDAPAQLASAPVVAFVRAQEDTTVDVFAAVSNPTRRVLLLNDVVGEPALGSRLQVDTVAQHYLRVSGTTASGEAGMLGKVTYTVGDGTEDIGASIQGEATVFLLPPAVDVAPIAVDDAVVVRAGSQIDIPVMENDVAAAGAGISLDPGSTTSSTDAALAFASGSHIRYLAPKQPGTYGITYTVYSTGSPSLADTATVTVTVLSDDLNRAPRPKMLEGRVLAGSTVTIPFDTFGVDPDGDTVMLAKILTQPAAGTASIAADGAGITYTSALGKPGQYSFTYSVVDAAGESSSGIARVGVLDDRANPSPITYTDYVQVQAGEASQVFVSPLQNDLDPTGGTMTVTNVIPNLAENLEDGSPNPEYDRWSSQILSQTDGSIEIAAGINPGTMSYIYSVESASGNTGRGLIVVKVVREQVPSYPVVSDTVLTAETRDKFPEGVDVLTGRVNWGGGDTGSLDVSLWGKPSGVSLSGREIRGELPEKSRIIPFAVTGTTSDGTEVTTYAFLRVPGKKDTPLTLRASAAAQVVEEGSSVSFNMVDLVGVPRDATLEVDTQVAASGARAEGVCRLTGGTTVEYTAGKGAPFADSCTVPVRLEGDDDWTFLSVPIIVTPLAPVPELRPGALTVSPGETATYDLTSMTVWQGDNDNANTVWQIDGVSADFVIRQSGSSVSVTAADAAVPGRESAVLVLITSHESVAPARLVLRVGPAPETAPRGGTTSVLCSQAEGNSCSVNVVGAPGEVNPLPRTPLTLVSVSSSAACTGVTFSVASATTVTASWTGDAPGATCRATFTLQDAQGRLTSGERNGSVTLDLQGYPLAPAAITQTGYDDGQVQLRVDPGGARAAYPAISGFTVTWNGAVVASCAADGTCPVIAAPNGEARVYEVVSVNAVGSSKTSVSTTAWAYNPPDRPATFTATAVPTQGQGHMVRLDFTGVDPETGHLEVTSPQGDKVTIPVSGGGTVSLGSYRVGTNESSQITAKPFSRFPIPAGLAGSTSGAEITTNGNGIGAPVNPTITASSTATANDTATITAEVSAQPNGAPSNVWYGVSWTNQPCVPSQTARTFSIPNLQGGAEYTVQMCAQARVGDTVFGTTTASTTLVTKQSTAAPVGFEFYVDSRGDIQDDDHSAVWTIKSEPTSSSATPYRNTVQFSGYPSSIIGADPNIAVYYQHESTGARTDAALATPAAGSAPYQVSARWDITSCVGDTTLGWSSSSTDGKATTVITGVTFYDEDGRRIRPTPADNMVPPDAHSVRVDQQTNWDSAGWGLGSVSNSITASCTPAPDPTPTSTEPSPSGSASPPSTGNNAASAPSADAPVFPTARQSAPAALPSAPNAAAAEPVVPESAPTDAVNAPAPVVPPAPPAEPEPITTSAPADADTIVSDASSGQSSTGGASASVIAPDESPPEPPPRP